MGRAIPGGELPSLHWGGWQKPMAVTTVVRICICLLQQLVVAEDSVLCDCLSLIAFISQKAQEAPLVYICAG